jgi:hypothetical protein
MKINVSFLAALILVGTDLVARAAIQGVEPALVLTASEYSYSWAKRLSGWARASFIDEINQQPDLIGKATVNPTGRGRAAAPSNDRDGCSAISA